jgi:hypothetical protein
MNFDDLQDFLERGRKAQAAVNEILSDHQQTRELQVDGTYRVLCNNCGKSVSSPLTTAVIVRASVICPECLPAWLDRMTQERP